MMCEEKRMGILGRGPKSIDVEMGQSSDGIYDVAEVQDFVPAPVSAVENIPMNFVPLSVREEVLLLNLETMIEKSIKTFIDVGNALLQIRDEHLYRNEKGRTFEGYLAEKWGLARRTGYQYIDSSCVYRNLELNYLADSDADSESESDSDCDENGFVRHGAQKLLPLNERQLRPLTKLSSADQVKAWAMAVDTAIGRGTTPNSRIVNDMVKSLGLAKTKEKTEKTIREITKSEIADDVKALMQQLLNAISGYKADGWSQSSKKDMQSCIRFLYESTMDPWDHMDSELSVSDKFKVMRKGFRVYRKLDGEKEIREATEKGGWTLLKRFETKTEMEKSFRELMKDPKNIRM